MKSWFILKDEELCERMLFCHELNLVCMFSSWSQLQHPTLSITRNKFKPCICYKKSKCLMQWWHYWTNRSSRPEVFCKKGVLRNFAKFTGKHLCQSLFFNKVAGFSAFLWILHRCFPVNFANFLRTPFLTEHFQWLLL